MKKFKIAIGFKIQSGPWGGGNQFAKSLVNYLEKQNVAVVFDLKDDDIDIILLTDPRVSSQSNSFGPVEIYKYLLIRKDTIVVHRINECDERKGTITINKQLSLGNSVADFTIYIASWLVELFKNQGLVFSEDYKVILNGADQNIFKNYNNRLEDNKTRIVTHHWGASYQKGWDIYILLDKLLSNDKYKNIEFHYIGKMLADYEPKNIIIHKPLSGEDLGMELSKYDIYLTASINEPAGMHHIEGAMCRLPLLYRNSGALPEYCDNFGVSFNDVHDFEDALNKIMETHKSVDMQKYKNSEEVMVKSYFELFENLLVNKNEIVKKRSFKNISIKGYLIFRYKFFIFRLMNWFGVR